MRAVGIKVLKNKLSEYVRLAASGETVLVTDRDRVVAELCPPREGRGPWVSGAAVADMVNQGWLTPAAKPGSGPPTMGEPSADLEDILSWLDEDRGGRPKRAQQTCTA